MSRNSVKADKIDIPVLLNSLASKPTYSSTFAWWHSSWCKEVPFWRPLTIQSFWLEKAAFTTDHFEKWYCVMFLFKLIFFALMGVYAFKLTKRRDIALLATALYGIPITIIPHLADFVLTQAPVDLVNAWKDQPDLWTDILILSALIFTFDKRYWLALLSATLAVCFKESGWFAFPLILLQLFYTRQIKSVPKSIFIGTLASIVLLAILRISSGVGHGFSMGTNEYWFNRYFGAVGGLYLTTAMAFPIAWLMGTTLFATVFTAIRCNRLISISVFATGIAITLTLAWFLQGTPVSSALISFVDYESPNFIYTVPVFVWLLLAAPLFFNRPALMRCSYVYVLIAITAVPFVMATQVLHHALHLSTCFGSIFVSIMFVNVYESWSIVYPAKKGVQREELIEELHDEPMPVG